MPTAKTQEYLQSDLIVFSHLRWDLGFQRPQHLMSRFSKQRRVFYVEDPIIGNFDQGHLHSEKASSNLQIVSPNLPKNLSAEEIIREQRRLIDELILSEDIENFHLWYYTPHALPYTDHLDAKVILYDCMDELSHAKHGRAEGIALEQDLMKRADLVFTGGQSLYESKQNQHPSVHCFPSSIDTQHFKQARTKQEEPEDQLHIAGIKVGFEGVIDERFDFDLLDKISKLRPNWQFILIGPMINIDASILPKHPNIHYLGKKDYRELPRYISGWDLAILPFVKNNSTRFLSSVKTPEYLAAGCPVVSTSITDVVRPYGVLGLVQIADEAKAFVTAGDFAMTQAKLDTNWLNRVDAYLSDKSWDQISRQMQELEQDVHERQMRAKEEGSAVNAFVLPKKNIYVPNFKA